MEPRLLRNMELCFVKSQWGDKRSGVAWMRCQGGPSESKMSRFERKNGLKDGLAKHVFDFHRICQRQYVHNKAIKTGRTCLWRVLDLYGQPSSLTPSFFRLALLLPAAWLPPSSLGRKPCWPIELESSRSWSSVWSNRVTDTRFWHPGDWVMATLAINHPEVDKWRVLLTTAIFDLSERGWN